MTMKPRLSIISILFFCLLISACGPRRLGPELTKDGVSFTFYAPEARSVAIAGTFNAWDTHKNRLSGPDNNSVWHIIIPLPEGRYEYLFIVDGKKWQPDPVVPEVDDGFGGKNSVLLIGKENPGL
jgi:1,4-alpha-glucan branching enzyme